jgi:hypothetical protein
VLRRTLFASMSSEKASEISTMPGIGKPTPRKRRAAPTRAAPARAASTRAAPTRAAPTKAGEVIERSSVYRGVSLDEARAAYHADARAMSRMGYAPTSEEWSTVLEHVLTVRYVYEPERQPAVLAALDAIEAEPQGALNEPQPAPARRLTRSINLWLALPLELRLSAGGIVGLLLGLALCVALGLVSGESPDMISLLGFGIIGVLLGASVGLIHADGP